MTAWEMKMLILENKSQAEKNEREHKFAMKQHEDQQALVRSAMKFYVDLMLPNPFHLLSMEIRQRTLHKPDIENP